YRTGIPRPRSAAGVGKPAVCKLPAGRDVSARTGANIPGSLVVFVVTQPVRMNTMLPLRAVQKVDNNRVADFSANHRAQNSQPLRLRFADGKRSIGVFDVAGLPPNGSVPPR